MNASCVHESELRACIALLAAGRTVKQRSTALRTVSSRLAPRDLWPPPPTTLPCVVPPCRCFRLTMTRGLSDPDVSGLKEEQHNAEGQQHVVFTLLAACTRLPVQIENVKLHLQL